MIRQPRMGSWSLGNALERLGRSVPLVHRCLDWLSARQGLSPSSCFQGCDEAADLVAFYKRKERQLQVAAGFLDTQRMVNPRMRGILIDWLVDLHRKFKLLPETLFLAVGLLDRFLECKDVARKHLQLAGVVALLLAAKYEEVWPPEVVQLLRACGGAYTRQQLLGMERIMLNVLGFNLAGPSTFTFLSRLLELVEGEGREVVVQYATYLAELALLDHAMLRFPYSLQAAAAVYAACLALGSAPVWTLSLAQRAGYSSCELHSCAAALAQLHREAAGGPLAAVYRKYSTPKLLRVARLGSPPPMQEGALLRTTTPSPARERPKRTRMDAQDEAEGLAAAAAAAGLELAGTGSGAGGRAKRGRAGGGAAGGRGRGCSGSQRG